MAFGKQYTYNPVPEKVGMLLVAYPNAGKTTFAAAFLNKPGKVSVVVDADGRFDEVVSSEMGFVKLSDEPSDNLRPKQILDICNKSMPNDKIGGFLVDSVTAILEPIILDIQRKVEEGKEKGARGYAEKSNAMKFLSAALSPWGTDVVYVYHYRDRGNTSGTIEKTTTITTLELARLYRNINMKVEIVVDANGKRGVKVLEARGGRTGMTIWDDSGKWVNIRQRMEEAIWGGLTKEEQDTLVSDTTVRFGSPEQAIAWGYNYSQDTTNFFDDAAHAKASYEKLKKSLYEELGSELNAEIMYEAWKQHVFSKEQEVKS